MKTRKELARYIRTLEIVASVLLVIGFLIVFFFNFGLIGIIVNILFYTLLTIYTYSIMKRCKCDRCSSTDVFIKSRGFTVTIDSRCHHCHLKLSNKPNY